MGGGVRLGQCARCLCKPGRASLSPAEAKQRPVSLAIKINVKNKGHKGSFLEPAGGERAEGRALGRLAVETGRACWEQGRVSEVWTCRKFCFDRLCFSGE